MAFQFRCPEGHLLQGEESQVGQQCECPFCRTQFLVPAPPGGASASSTGWPPPQDGSQEPVHQDQAEQYEEELPTEWAPGVSVGQSIVGMEQVVAENPFETDSAEEREVFHIPCPKGHVLETPRDMLGQYAQCPFCQTEFQLLLRDSHEYQAEVEKKQERREHKAGKLWMNWAIAAAVVVLFAVILMTAIAVSH